MAVLRVAWALLALSHVTRSMYLPTEHSAAAGTRDVSSGSLHQLVGRQTTTCGASNPCEIGCCGNGGDVNNA